MLPRVRGAGLIIRDVRQPALPASLRISVGTPAQNQRVLESLQMKHTRAEGAVRRSRRHADRGTADEQVDSLDKIRWMPDVFASLQKLTVRRLPAGDGHQPGWPGHAQLSAARTSNARRSSSSIRLPRRGCIFDAICICPHKPADGCDCRKPKLGHR